MAIYYLALRLALSLWRRGVFALLAAGEDEGIYLARFDLLALRDYRARETWGNAFRKPRSDGALASMEVKEPFRRPQSRR